MLMLMLNFKGRSLLVVTMEKDNLDRMKKADPITLESTLAGGLLPPPLHPENFSVLFAYEEDDVELYRRAKGNVGELIRWLERGRTWKEGVDGKKNAFNMPKERP